MRLAVAATLILALVGCGAYESRSLDRSMPSYPGAQFVSRTAECGDAATGGTVCSSESLWTMRRATPEAHVVAWYARHLRGWHYLDCGTGFTKGHAYLLVTTSARTLDVYVDAHGADHCDAVPAG